MLEQELDREVYVLECQVGRVYLQWLLENVRGPFIRRLLELNRQLGINVPLIFRRIYFTKCFSLGFSTTPQSGA